MKNLFQRVVSVVMVCALLADPTLAAIASIPQASIASTLPNTNRLQEDALACRSYTALHAIPPFFRTLSGQLKEFIQQPKINTPVESEPASKDHIHQPTLLVRQILKTFHGFPLPKWITKKVEEHETWRNELAEQTGHIVTRVALKGFQDQLQQVADKVGGPAVGITIFQHRDESDIKKAGVERQRDPLVRVAVGELKPKEAMFADTSEPYLSRRNAWLGWMIAYAKGYTRIHKPSNNWQLLFGIRFARVLRLSKDLPPNVSPAEVELDFAATLNTLLHPIMLWRIWWKIRRLVQIPPVPLNQINAAFDVHVEKSYMGSSERDKQLIKTAYYYAGTNYINLNGSNKVFPSGRSYFSKDTYIGLGTAKKEGADVIAAALLQDMLDLQVSIPTIGVKIKPNLKKDRLILALQQKFAKENIRDPSTHAKHIVNLILALKRLQLVPFFREIPEGKPNYSAAWSSHRLFEVACVIAKEYDVKQSSLMALFFASQSQIPSTLEPQREKDRLKRIYMSTITTFAFTAERLGRGKLSSLLQDEAFGHFKKEERQRTRERVLEARGLTHHQTETQLAFLANRSNEVLQGFGIDPVTVLEATGDSPLLIKPRTKEKTYYRIRTKNLLERIYEDPNADIEGQMDFAGVMNVLKAEDFERVYRHLATDMGTTEQPMSVMQHRTRIIKLDGKPAYQIMNIQYDNPYHEDSKITWEQQIMKDQYYPLYISGLGGDVKYTRPHSQYAVKGNVDVETGNAVDGKPYIGQQFDYRDDRLTGIFERDVTAITAKIGTDWIVPGYSLDDAAMTDDDLGKFSWPELKLPKDAVYADLAFHPQIGGTPDEYYEPREIVFVPDETSSTGFRIRRDAVGLEEKIGPGALIVFERKLKPRTYSTAGKKRLYKIVTTSWAKLRIIQSLAKEMDEKYKINKAQKALVALGTQGQEKFQTKYGNMEGPGTKEEILDPALYWLGLSQEEFYQAFALGTMDLPTARQFLETIGLSPTNREIKFFSRIDQDFETWYSQYYVQINFHKWETPNTYKIIVNADENQVSLLFELTRVLREKGLVLAGVQAISKGGGAIIELSIQKKPGILLDSLVQSMREIRRHRGDKPVDPQARRLEIHLLLPPDKPAKHPETHYAVINLLSSLNIDIESLSPKEDWVTLNVLAPPQFKNFPGLSPMSMLEKKLIILEDQGLIAQFEVKQREVSEASILAIKHFMLQEALRMPQIYWKFLPFDPGTLKLPDPDPDQVDDVFVEEFIKAWRIAGDYHGHLKPDDPMNNKWAKMQFRDNGSPYTSHLIEATWNFIDVLYREDPYLIQYLRDPELIKAMPLHDLFEDGVGNILKLRKDISKDAAQKELETRILQDYPPFVAEALLRRDKALSRGDQSYYEYLDEVMNSGDPGEIFMKIADQMSNVSHISSEAEANRPRRLGRAVRYYLNEVRNGNVGLKNPKDLEGRAFPVLALLARIILESTHVQVLSPYYHVDDTGQPKEDQVKADQQTFSDLQLFLTWWARWRKGTPLIPTLMNLGLNIAQVNHFQELLQNFSNLLGHRLAGSPETSPPDPDDHGSGEAPSDIRTAHLPLIFWRPFRESLKKAYTQGNLSKQAYETIIEEGKGVAHLNQEGNIVIIEEGLPSLLEVLNHVLDRSPPDQITLQKLRDYLVTHEKTHQQAYAKPAVIAKLIQELRDPSFYSPTSRVTNYDQLKHFFTNNYGEEFNDDWLFAEELWVAYKTHYLLFGETTKLVTDTNQPLQTQIELPPAISALLAEFSTRYFPGETGIFDPRMARTLTPISDEDRSAENSYDGFLANQEPFLNQENSFQNLIEQQIKIKKRVVYVDIGPGYGIALRQAKKLFGKDLKTYGVDPVNWFDQFKKKSDLMASYRHQLGEDIFDEENDYQWIRAYMQDVRLPQRADVISAIYSMPYSMDPLSALMNLYNQLSSENGIIIGNILPERLFLKSAPIQKSTSKLLSILVKQMQRAGVDIQMTDTGFFLIRRHNESRLELNLIRSDRKSAPTGGISLYYTVIDPKAPLVQLKSPGHSYPASLEGSNFIASGLHGLVALFAGQQANASHILELIIGATLVYLLHALLHQWLGGTIQLPEDLQEWYHYGIQEDPPPDMSAWRRATFYLLPGVLQLLGGTIVIGATLQTNSQNPTLIALGVVNLIQALTIIIGADRQGWKYLLHSFRMLRSA